MQLSKQTFFSWRPGKRRREDGLLENWISLMRIGTDSASFVTYLMSSAGHQGNRRRGTGRDEIVKRKRWATKGTNYSVVLWVESFRRKISPTSDNFLTLSK